MRNVFVDSNIFLSFYDYNKKSLDTLKSVFDPNSKNFLTYLPEQVVNEIKRNRDSRLNSSFGELQSSFKSREKMGYPNYVLQEPECLELLKLDKQIKKLQKKLLTNVEKKIEDSKLHADEILSYIIDNNKTLETTEAVYQKAKKRYDLGSPPYKSNACLGDSVIWVQLLEHCSKGDLHVISDDKDYYSSFGNCRANLFLIEEWKAEKNGNLYIHKDLESFIKEYKPSLPFETPVFSYKLKTDVEEYLRPLVDQERRYGINDVTERMNGLSNFSISNPMKNFNFPPDLDYLDRLNKQLKNIEDNLKCMQVAGKFDKKNDK